MVLVRVYSNVYSVPVENFSLTQRKMIVLNKKEEKAVSRNPFRIKSMKYDHAV